MQSKNNGNLIDEDYNQIFNSKDAYNIIYSNIYNNTLEYKKPIINDDYTLIPNSPSIDLKQFNRNDTLPNQIKKRYNNELNAFYKYIINELKDRIINKPIIRVIVTGNTPGSGLHICGNAITIENFQLLLSTIADKAKYSTIIIENTTCFGSSKLISNIEGYHKDIIDLLQEYSKKTNKKVFYAYSNDNDQKALFPKNIKIIYKQTTENIHNIAYTPEREIVCTKDPKCYKNESQFNKFKEKINEEIKKSKQMIKKEQERIEKVKEELPMELKLYIKNEKNKKNENFRKQIKIRENRKNNIKNNQYLKKRQNKLKKIYGKYEVSLKNQINNNIKQFNKNEQML